MDTAKKPNILFIMCDQMRGDCLGFAGHPDVKTPYLDSIAGQGTWFPNAYSACPSCVPARAALFTGLAPEHHGRVGYRDGIAWDYPHMLPREMNLLGYQTECIGKMHVHPPMRRCGFETLQLHDGTLGCYRHPDDPARLQQARHDRYLRFLRRQEGADADVTDPGLDNNSWIVRPWPYRESSHPTNWAAAQTIEAIRDRDPDRPFFLMTSFVRPHPPLDAPACYLEPYLNRELAAPAAGDWDDPAATEAEGWMYDSLRGCRDPEQRRRAMAGYYACISHMDMQIGRILQVLYEENILEDTIIVFTSDHGEMLFDHSLFRKALPYQGSIRIPLLVRIGKNLPGGPEQPRVCRQLAELQDLMPTFLSLAGGQPDFAMDGLDLTAYLRQPETEGRQLLFGEHAYGALSSQFVVTGHDKLVWFSQSGRFQYFDLAADPREEHDLFGQPEHAARIETLRQALTDHLRDRPEGYVQDGCLTAGRTPVDSLPILQEYAAGRNES